MSIGVYSDAQWNNRWYSRRRVGGWGRDPCWACQQYREHRCVAICGTKFRTKFPELVLDFKGCNLDCKFCWAYDIKRGPSIRKMPREVICDLFCRLKSLRSDKWIRERWENFTSLRLTGNEPTLQWNHLVEVLKILDDYDELITIGREIVGEEASYFANILRNLEVVIQTNGIAIGKPCSGIDVNDLKDFINLKIRFEVSFKGVNPEQFVWLTDANREMFYWQCDGFAKLWNIRNDRIKVVPVLGINHADRIKKCKDMKVWIIDESGCKMDFEQYDEYFIKKVLSVLKDTSIKFDVNCNVFEEFKGIDCERARQVIATIYKGKVYKNKLPSELRKYLN